MDVLKGNCLKQIVYNSQDSRDCSPLQKESRIFLLRHLLQILYCHQICDKIVAETLYMENLRKRTEFQGKVKKLYICLQAMFFKKKR